MRRTVFGGVALVVLTVAAYAGDEPWKTKPFDQWTDKDLNAVYQNSPWAKPNVQAMGAWRPMGSATMEGPTPGAIAGSSADNSKTSQGTLGEQMGGAEKTKQAQAAAASQVYTILWWSSRTMREAAARQAVLRGSMSQEDATKAIAQGLDEYEIMVQAQNMLIFQKRGEKSFQTASYHQMHKSKLKLQPSQVTFRRGSDGETVVGAVFHFPKKTAAGEPTIGTEEKSVDFFLQIGESRLLTEFDLRKMVDRQGADL